jgi:type I restriction enzyme M protein
MVAIEEENPQLKGVLPRTYQALSNSTLVSLLRSINAILGDIGGDAFGKVGYPAKLRSELGGGFPRPD